mmetsp:Transcript_12546/g.40086  ORF Transcript_12546/g.40086 Transcript_12546/m.40086 type:complete len:240 (-) Transcript_12546:1067-1786(-)
MANQILVKLLAADIIRLLSTQLAPLDGSALSSSQVLLYHFVGLINFRTSSPWPQYPSHTAVHLERVGVRRWLAQLNERARIRKAHALVVVAKLLPFDLLAVVLVQQGKRARHICLAHQSAPEYHFMQVLHEDGKLLVINVTRVVAIVNAPQLTELDVIERLVSELAEQNDAASEQLVIDVGCTKLVPSDLLLGRRHRVQPPVDKITNAAHALPTICRERNVPADEVDLLLASPRDLTPC